MHTLTSDEIRDLKADDLDTVSGGRNALIEALVEAYLAIKSVNRTLQDDPEPTPYVPMTL
jgi:hypothetical protein